MSEITRELHASFLRALGSAVANNSDPSIKPLELDLALPLPPRLRVYMYSLVDGASAKRKGEYKAVLRVPRQRPGAYDSFDHSGGRFAMVVAYRTDLDVFVLWDASLHARFKNGGNIQVRDSTVHSAAATGYATQVRALSGGISEVVIACQSSNLALALNKRIAWTGGVEEGEWETSEALP